MAIKSSSYSIRMTEAGKERATSRKDRLLATHSADVERVISDAKAYSESRKQAIKRLANKLSRRDVDR